MKISVVGGVHPADCTGEQNYPNKPRYQERKPFQQGKPDPRCCCFREAQIRVGKSTLCCSLQGEHIQTPSSSMAGAPVEPRGALRGSCAWGLPSGHQEPIAGGNRSAPGAKARKNVKAPGPDSQYPSRQQASFIVMGHERTQGCHSPPGPAAPEERALSANSPPHAPVANVTLKNDNGEDNWVGSGKKKKDDK